MRNSADPAGTIAAIGRSVLERAHYLVLGTADGAGGRPWTSPVYFATLECREFFWVSAPDARHSRNIQIRPQVSTVVFDSTVGCPAVREHGPEPGPTLARRDRS